MSDKKLVSLEDSNKIARAKYFGPNERISNWIACPLCGSALYDSNPSFVLTSYPPQKETACTKCVYTGYRIA